MAGADGFGDALGGADGTGPPAPDDVFPDALAVRAPAGAESWEPFRLPALPVAPGAGRAAAEALVGPVDAPSPPGPVPLGAWGQAQPAPGWPASATPPGWVRAPVPPGPPAGWYGPRPHGPAPHGPPPHLVAPERARATRRSALAVAAPVLVLLLLVLLAALA